MALSTIDAQQNNQDSFSPWFGLKILFLNVLILVILGTKEHDFLERFRRAKKRLLVFDYGGTLTEQDAQATSFCSKAPDEDEHEMPRAVKKAIQMLTEDSNTMVGVISGQKKEILQASFNGLDKVILSAEKGAYHRFPGKSDWEICPDITLDWQPVVLDIMR